MDLENKVIVVTGGLKGVGLAITRQLLANQVQVVVLGSPLQDLAMVLEGIGLEETSIKYIACDLRQPEAIKTAINDIHEAYQQIDALIYNASVVDLSMSIDLEPKRFDLMLDVNAKALWHMVNAAYMYLNDSIIKQVIAICPPINLDPNCLATNLPYAASRYLAGILLTGLAKENPSLRVNALWPKTNIDAEDICNVLSATFDQGSGKRRSANIMADACLALLQQKAYQQTGEFFIDEEVLRNAGMEEMGNYELEDAGMLAVEED